MARIDLPLGLESTENLPRSKRNLQNLWNSNGKIIQRPGINSLTTTGKVARGQFEWNDSLYQVVSQSLIKITNTSTGAHSTNGTAIAGSGNVETDVGFNTAVIVDPGGQLYTLDTSDVVTDITANSNFVSCNDVAFINGRFVYIPANGDPAFFSDVGAAGTVQAASFFDAEELPDKNNSAFNLNNTLYIGGTDSFELFRDTGATPNPFIRITGSRIRFGYIGGLLEYADTFLFIGREIRQDRGIYAISQSGAQKVSNQAIDTILAGYTIAELKNAVSGRIKWRGDDIATFTLGRDSFGFFNGNWFVLETVISEIPRPWAAGFITEFEGDYFSASSGNIGKFAKTNTDYSDTFTRLIDFGFDHPDSKKFTCQNIELGISQGFNTSATTGSVAIFMSRNNVTYGPPVFRNVGVVGEYDKKLIWNPPGGLGNYDRFMGVRLYSRQDIDMSSDYIDVKLR